VLVKRKRKEKEKETLHMLPKPNLSVIFGATQYVQVTENDWYPVEKKMVFK